MQAAATALARESEGVPLALTLSAGAVRLAADDLRLEHPGACEWQAVLGDLRECLADVRLADYAAPLKAYAMSIARLPARKMNGLTGVNAEHGRRRGEFAALVCLLLCLLLWRLGCGHLFVIAIVAT